MASMRRVAFASSRIIFLYLLPLGLAVVGQEEIELFNTHEPASTAVSVGEEQLPAVASNVLQAESWLRNHVLSRYPSTNIAAIVVGKDVLCAGRHEYWWPLVLPSVKNLHYSLVRWGLLREIRISVVFSSDCLDRDSTSAPATYTFRDDLAEDRLLPLLHFLRSSNSIYAVTVPSTHTSPLTHSRRHQNALAKLGFSQFQIAFLKEHQNLPRGRKLITSFFSSPYPEKPKPSNHQLQAPTPAASASLPAPAPHITSPFSFVPSASPSEIPANPPDALVDPPTSKPPDTFDLPPPPCSAATPGTAQGEEKNGLWCVAKPAVPVKTLQEAMDYACGNGGADCAEIGLHGNCYFPDNVVAHASYAFNSYWQKTKRSGGSCGFGGTAILVDSDPSFQRCRFELS